MANETENYSLITEYINGAYSVETANTFFNKLHSLNGTIYRNKRFSLKVKDIGKMWGRFKGVNYEFIDEEQQMELNSFENYRNDLYRKSLQLINYLHETTHEKQKDKYLLNNDKQATNLEDYEKLINLEVFCNDEAELCNYEQQLIEIDAIYNSIFDYKKLLDNGVLPNKEETLAVALYACVRYFASINGSKHHVYYPEQFHRDSSNLIKYYKKFYANLEKNDHNSNETLKQVIDSSDLCYSMKNELKNIDFNKVESILDEKTEKIYFTMEQFYNELLKMYEPSNEMLKYLNVSYDNFNSKVESNNIVKMSALICDDVHSKFSDKTIIKIGPTPKCNEDEQGI